MSYLETREEIYNILNSVEGLNKVFKSYRHPTNWETFFELYRDRETQQVSIVYFYLTNPINENIENDDASYDAERFVNITSRTETWRITFIYTFKDDDTNPSEFAFSTICESIENKFRFLQNLNGKAFQSFPLQTVFRDVGQWDGKIMVHRADFNLLINQRIINDSEE